MHLEGDGTKIMRGIDSLVSAGKGGREDFFNGREMRKLIVYFGIMR